MLKFSEICLKRYKTAVLYLSFLSLGLSIAIPGPTLLDLSTIVQTDISHIASIYLARSSGYLLGSFLGSLYIALIYALLYYLGGILLDYLKKKVLLLTLFNFVITVGVFATPWCRDVYTLVTVMAVSGLAMGALDTGGNVWCLDLWGENSSRYFQTLHFLFGVGAFSAPLIAEPYLAQQNNEHSFSNTSSPDNHLLNHSGFLSNSSFLKSLPSITYAYGIIGLFSLLVTLMFAVLFCVSVKEESKKKEKPNTNYKESSACISVLAIFCSSLLLAIYAGIEIGYGQMIATFCVKSNLHLSKATASLITSVYWGTFTFSRGVSIILASKLTPLSLIVTDFVLMLLASIILVLFGSSFVEFLWIGTAVLGLALASFYPTTITWVERHLNISNKVASAFVVAASLGEMIVPLAISQFMDSFPEVLLYIVVYSVVACGILIFILWIILKSIGNKYVIEQPVPNNGQENESCDLNVPSDSHENGSSELNSQNEIEDSL